MRIQLTYFQVDEELILRFERHYTAQQLQEEVEACWRNMPLGAAGG